MASHIAGTIEIVTARYVRNCNGGAVSGCFLRVGHKPLGEPQLLLVLIKLCLHLSLLAKLEELLLEAEKSSAAELCALLCV